MKQVIGGIKVLLILHADTCVRHNIASRDKRGVCKGNDYIIRTVMKGLLMACACIIQEYVI